MIKIDNRPAFVHRQRHDTSGRAKIERDRWRVEAGSATGLQYNPPYGFTVKYSILFRGFNVHSGEPTLRQANRVRFYDKHLMVAPHKQDLNLKGVKNNNVKKIIIRAHLDGDWVFRVPSELAAGKFDHIMMFDKTSIVISCKKLDIDYCEDFYAE